MFVLQLTVVFCLVSSALLAQTRPSDEGFELVKERDDVKIFERWVFFPKSDPPVEAREVKGEFFAQCSIDEAVALIRDQSQIGRWQSHVSKFRVYPVNDSLWHEYSYHDIPWPVSDQDHYLEYRVVTSIPGKELFLTFESTIDDARAPVHEDATRMTLAGSWLFENLNGKTRITYRILSMPLGIPRIFTDPVIRSNMMSTITSYVELLEANGDAGSK